MTLPVGLAALQGFFASDFRAIAAGVTMTVIPILLFFIVVQRYFVRGLAGRGQGLTADARSSSGSMLAFDGRAARAGSSERLADGAGGGDDAVPVPQRRDRPAQVRELTAAVQRAAAAPAADAGRPAAHRRRPGGRPAPRAGRRGDAVRRQHGARRGRRRGPRRAGRARRSGSRLRAMGVNVVYAPVLRPRDEPGQPGARDPLVRRRPGRRRAARRGDGPRPAVGRGRRRGQALPGPRRRRTRHAPRRWRSSQRQRATTSTAASSSPFRAAIAAGARLVMSAHVAVPALTGDPTLPATLSRTVMADLLRDELGFGGRDDQRRARHAGARPGRGPGGRGHRRDPRRRRPAPAARRTGPPSAGSRRRSARLRARGLFDAGRTGGLERAPGRPSTWLAAAATASRISRSSARAEHARALARARGAGADQLDRGADGAEPAPIAFAPSTRILAIMPEPTDLTPADTSSAVPPGLGRALRRGSRRSTRSSCRSPRAMPRSAACGRAPSRSMPSSSGPSRRIASPRQAALVGAIAETGTPTVAVALRTPWDVASSTRPACPRRARTRSCPIARGARARARGRDRASRAGSRWRSRPAPDDAFATRSASSPTSPRGSSPTRPRRRVDRRVAPRAPPSSTSSSPPAARRDHAAIYAQYVLGVRHGCRSGSGRRRSSRSTARSRTSRDALVIGISQSGASPDIVARHRRGPRARAPRRSRSPTSPTRRWRPPRTGRSPSAPARNGRSPRPRPTRPSCSRSRCCRRR